MADRLNDAARAGDIRALHQLLREDPRILDRVDDGPFADTPLHVAASEGMANFASEVAILKPSFTTKLNPEGLSPMHVALHAQHWKAVRALMMIDAELIRVKGTGGKTPLHVAAELAPEQLLAEFLFVCPSSIFDVTAEWETAMHIAIRNRNVGSFEVLFGWLIRAHKSYVLDWKDINGDTALHLATRARLNEVAEMLVQYSSIHEKNFDDKTPWDIDVDQGTQFFKGITRWSYRGFAQRVRGVNNNRSLRKYYGRGLDTLEKTATLLGFQRIEDGDEKSQKSRDVVLLVATLVATATYQAMLTPPGGYWQNDSVSDSTPAAVAHSLINTQVDSNATAVNSTGGSVGRTHHAGQLILAGQGIFNFGNLNSLAFCLSLVAIVTNVTELRQRRMLNLAMTLLLLSYGMTLSLNLNSQGKAISDNSWTWFPQSMYIPPPSMYIPFLTSLVCSCYIITGFYLSVLDLHGHPVNSSPRNIHRLVRCS